MLTYNFFVLKSVEHFLFRCLNLNQWQEINAWKEGKSQPQTIRYDKAVEEETVVLSVCVEKYPKAERGLIIKWQNAYYSRCCSYWC